MPSFITSGVHVIYVEVYFLLSIFLTWKTYSNIQSCMGSAITLKWNDKRVKYFSPPPQKQKEEEERN